MTIDNDFIFSGRGSTALYAILQSLNCKVKRILVPVNICEIVIPVIQLAGFSPTFYDVDPNTGNSDLVNIKDKYSGDEGVLLAVHNFGLPVEIDLISEWAKEKGVFLIEDVCNALGATYKNFPLGEWGDASIFSFGYAKIVELGFGGALKVKDPELREGAKELISTFEFYSNIYNEADIDFQSKLRTIRKEPDNQNPATYCPLYKDYARFLIYQLDEDRKYLINNALFDLDKIILSRYQKAMMYKNGINSAKVLHSKEIEGQIYWRYNILVEHHLRDELLKLLIHNNIWASKWYPPVNRLFFDDIDSEGYPGANSFSKSVINLFVDERFSIAEVERTIRLINQF